MTTTGQSEFARARGLFVTGTDTEVGKTVIAGGIARVLKDKGQKVGVFKPVASGCRSSRGELVCQDAEFLAHCADAPETLDQICPVRFREPLAPEVAAKRGAEPIELGTIRTYYNRLASAKEVMIVEGIGGLLVPLATDLLVAEVPSKRGFGYKQDIGAQLCEAIRKRGVILRPLGDVIVVMPPLSICLEDIDRLFDAVGESLRDCRSLLESAAEEG